MEEKTMVRLGVVGAGAFASRRHIPEALANPHVSLEAICRRDPQHLAQLMAHFHIAKDRAFAEWNTMLDSVELDAVLIATPNNLHYSMAKLALERGLHVLIEKPMTLAASEAFELVRLAKEKKLQLAVALNPPHWAHCHQIRRALRHPDMGCIESCSIFWATSAASFFSREGNAVPPPGVVPPTPFRADPEQNGGGYFVDGGTHLVSQLLWLTQLKPKRVSALMDSYPTDMRVTLSLEMENGAMASITSVGDSGLANRRLRNIIACSQGTVTVNGWEFDTTIMMLGQEHRRFKEVDLQKVQGPLDNFVSAILEGKPLYSPAEHGAEVVEVVEAAYLSATQGVTVTLPLHS